MSKDTNGKRGPGSLKRMVRRRTTVSALEAIVRAGLGPNCCRNTILTFDGKVYEVTWRKQSGLVHATGKTLGDAVRRFMRRIEPPNDPS